MKTFNINNIIKVKLTDCGRDIYYHQHDELNKYYGKEVIKPRYPDVDEDGLLYFNYGILCKSMDHTFLLQLLTS